MKRILLLIAIVSTLSSCAQHGLRINYQMPIGSFGYILKPSTGIQYDHMITDQYDNLRIGASIGFVYYQARVDTVRYLTIESSSNGSRALPSEFVIEKFYSLPLMGFIEYKFGDDKKISPLIGGSVFGEFNQLNYSDKVKTLIDKSVTGSSSGIGLTTYVGSVYELNDSFNLTARFGYRYAYELTLGSYSHLFFSVGLTFYNY